MREDEVYKLKVDDIAEVEVTPTYATVTLLNREMLLIGVPAAHQLLQIMGEDRLLNVTCKYGDKIDAKKLH